MIKLIDLLFFLKWLAISVQCSGVHITIMAWFSKEHHKFLLGTQSHASRFGQFFGYNKIQNRIGHWIKIRLCEMQKSKHNLNHHLFHPKCSFFSFLDVNVEPHNLLSLHCKMFGTQKSTNTQKCGAHVTFSVLMSTKKPLMCTAAYSTLLLCDMERLHNIWKL